MALMVVGRWWFWLGLLFALAVWMASSMEPAFAFRG
jgi:hypothetical protein